MYLLEAGKREARPTVDALIVMRQALADCRSACITQQKTFKTICLLCESRRARLILGKEFYCFASPLYIFYKCKNCLTLLVICFVLRGEISGFLERAAEGRETKSAVRPVPPLHTRESTFVSRFLVIFF